MNNLHIVKTDKLTEVRSLKEFKTGATVLFICCEESKIPTQHTTQLDDNYHIIDPIMSEVNHSFDPNVSVEGHLLIATRKIRVGDEIVRNYYETEEIIVKTFIDRETGDVVNTKNLYNYKHGADELLFDTEHEL